MSKKQIKKIIFMGVGCALLLIVGTIYSLLYNNGRWVKNMDMSEYVFSYKDIPMLVIGALIALYAIYIIIICFKNVFLKNSREKTIFKNNFSLLGILWNVWFSGV